MADVDEPDDGQPILLSPPDVGARERELLLEAFDSGWIAPVGPALDDFEAALRRRCDTGHAVALSSGTAALHLALRVLGVEAGDDVACSDLTFAASVNAVTYLGARPVLVDAEARTWQLDPDLLAGWLAGRARQGRLPAAVVAVDLYGQCADYDRLLAVCAEYDVPLVEDAAEALGSTYRGRPAGSLGAIGVLSFNGNKVITTSGGGALVSDRADWVEHARFLATQARDPAPHYEHSQVGYNYRLSNLLAAVGTAQLETLDDKVAARRATNAFYRKAFADLPGVEFMPEADYGHANCWLTCVTIDPAALGVSREDIRAHLAARNIEARPVWKPMHRQPVYADCELLGGGVGDDLFDRGLCLPSGSVLTDADRERVAAAVREAAGH